MNNLVVGEHKQSVLLLHLCIINVINAYTSDTQYPVKPLHFTLLSASQVL